MRNRLAQGCYRIDLCLTLDRFPFYVLSPGEVADALSQAMDDVRATAALPGGCASLSPKKRPPGGRAALKNAN